MDIIESGQWSIGGTWRQPENGEKPKQVRNVKIETEPNRVQPKLYEQSKQCFPMKDATFSATS